MLTIHTVEQMREMDALLGASMPMDHVIDRAGYGVAMMASRILGRTYGAKVVVVVGKGNNGRDGRAAAKVLSGLGARVEIEPYEATGKFSHTEADLVIDAVFGFGFRGDFGGIANLGGARLLALDMPSGLDAQTGHASAATHEATFTVSLVAMKLGQLIGEGPRLCGETYLYPLAGSPSVEPAGWLVQPRDIDIADRDMASHKWSSALGVFAGSVGMSGAAVLSSGAAMRAGAGIVHLFSRDSSTPAIVSARVPEVVIRPVEFVAGPVGFEPMPELSKFAALVIGPGLGADAGAMLGWLADRYDGPLVIDADAVVALGQDPRLLARIAKRRSPSILTPHGGELERLIEGSPSQRDHYSLRQFALSHGVFLLVKGYPTKIYSPDGEFYVVAANGRALASAGTGDVLSGIIGARVASGRADAMTIAEAVMIHGLSAQVDPGPPLTSLDLLERIPAAMRFLSSARQGLWPESAFVPIGSRGPLYLLRQSKIDWERR